MFPVKAKAILPIEKVVIRSVSVRGELGPLTVWVSNEDAFANNNNNGDNGPTHTVGLTPRHWTKVYEKKLAPSRRVYQTLDLSKTPIVLKPGQVRMFYVSTLLA